ncbi:MAG: hypothetical protein AAGF97_00080 [Planctomycetota bacterium]
MSAVPFTVDFHGGLAEAAGVIHIHQDRLWVDYEVQDGVAGILKAKHKTGLPLNKVTELIFKPGWWSSRLLVRVIELDLLDEIPWSEGAEFIVKVRKGDRERVDELVEEFTWHDPPLD